MTPETPAPPPEGVTLSGHFLVSASEIAELAELRAQAAQYRDPQTIVTLALAYAATRAHDEGRTIGELRKAACILFGAGMVDAAIDKARGK